MKANQGLFAWNFEQPALVEVVPAQDREVGTRWFSRFLAAQTILEFCDFIRSAREHTAVQAHSVVVQL